MWCISDHFEVTHETRHEYQSDVKKMSGRYKAPQSVVDSWSTLYPERNADGSFKDYNEYWNHPKEMDTRAEGSQVWVEWKENKEYVKKEITLYIVFLIYTNNSCTCIGM